MKFLIDQLALCPRDPARAKDLLTAMGAHTWVEDHVTAKGSLCGTPVHNEADLSFNYDMAPGSHMELEVLNYTHGANWMDTFARRGSRVSHLGMHCTAEELPKWITFFAARNIPVIQAVTTLSHTNPAIAGTRWYQYVIFDTLDILGTDLKFIVRRMEP